MRGAWSVIVSVKRDREFHEHANTNTTSVADILQKPFGGNLSSQAGALG